MIIALDIDDTITAEPRLFAALSKAPGIQRVIIVTSRSDFPEIRQQTQAELRDLGIHYDALYLLPNHETAAQLCPHDNLDGYRKYLWQKVKICLDENVDVIFEDDAKVIALFKQFAPDIQVVQVH